MKNIKRIFTQKPEALIVHSFLMVILLGAVLLKLPFSTVKTPLSWVDSIFMSVSAVCVTGLTLVDISKDLTIFGQMVILTLIQLGGIGIMTFSLLFLILLGRKISLPSRLCVPHLSRDINVQNIKQSVFFIFKMAIAIELAGAVLLFLNFKDSYPLPFAIYTSIFHAVSGFCNAGFSLYSDSFMRFNNNPYILSVLMFLITAGGLGFIVIYEISNIFSRNKARLSKIFLSLHTKIALIASLSFVLFGAGIIWLLESRGILNKMPAGLALLNAFFLSVTSRTAGFNTVDTSSLSNPTLILVLMMMFIGGCPGSTAGGIKIHTFVSLIALIKNKLKGLSMASIFKRKIPNDIIDRAIMIFISSALIIFTAVFLLQLAENVKVSHFLVSEREEFFDTLFEAISAFGTVGLSTGTTTLLSSMGKIIITILMFVGRIGPLTLGIALQMRQKRNIVYEFPEEDIIVS